MLLHKPGFESLTPEEKANICNGIGPAGILGDLIPETNWGLKMTPAGDRHDYEYHTAENLADKLVADVVFLFNLWELIEDGTKWLKWIRQNRVIKMFLVVLYAGRFFLDKRFEKPEFYGKSLSKVHEYALGILGKPYSYEIISNDIYRIWVQTKMDCKKE